MNPRIPRIVLYAYAAIASFLAFLVAEAGPAQAGQWAAVLKGFPDGMPFPDGAPAVLLALAACAVGFASGDERSQRRGLTAFALAHLFLIASIRGVGWICLPLALITV